MVRGLFLAEDAAAQFHDCGAPVLPPFRAGSTASRSNARLIVRMPVSGWSSPTRGGIYRGHPRQEAPPSPAAN